MKIDINTKFITLIGTPLSQSYAAAMQNAAYDAMGLNYCYFYTERDSTHLQEILNGVRHMNFAGCAVTKPNKVNVMKYLDETDPLCALAGSSNTIVIKDGKLIGHNTDATGFFRALTEKYGSVEGKKIYCFGAGGVGRAIIMALANGKASKIFITDYFNDSAKKMADDVNAHFANVGVYVPFESFEHVEEADIYINATGIGMAPHLGETPLPEKYVKSDAFYFDACYNPEKTQFLLNAEKAGAGILNGLSMSLYQGVDQIKLWTGEEPPVEIMRETLDKITKK